MPDLLSSSVLGLVQGLTEFIPVSSSGHLILVREWLRLPMGPDDLAFDAVLQLATVCAVIVYFRKEIIELIHSGFLFCMGKEILPEQRTMLLTLVVATIPAVIAGLLLESYMETVFRSGALVACTLIAGAVLMYAADRYARQNATLTLKRGLAVGFFQVLALVPGISRSGATISGGLFAGLSREVAAKFSFFLSIPILLGSGLKKILELFGEGISFSDAMPLITGSAVAFISGIAAVHFLISYLRTHNLALFIWYRIGLAAVLLLVFFA